ncbi:Disease resistance protein [Quillaja saponaria]|uniref:Disease resistance protein n=1 Tax=Quillaja saponaria TaxID=32244 RepID=A0AAD7LNR5_QUISA|nr:Disease resistance protein [Quillaja saponaria]
MGCQLNDIFEVSLLSHDEAWDLFKEMAGNSVENLQINPTAKEVAHECGRLPLAIVTVAKALRDKEHYEWLDALGQLKTSTVSSFTEMQECVYSRIQLSFNLLGNDEEAKSCLLLCCLFPEDYDIPIEYLLRYGVGLRLFKGLTTLLSARYRVHTLVDKLKSRYLLLDSDKKECIKMHDIVRDVSLSFATRAEHRYMVCCDKERKEWQDEDKWHRSTVISIFIEKDKDKFPTGLECPQLKLLHVSTFDYRSKIPTEDSFFPGMRELMVMTLSKLSISSMPSSLEALQNLHTLCLDSCKLENISIIGTTLKNLEILSFARSYIKEFPKEIGLLSNLKLLDLSGSKLKRIPSGVLTSFSRLEELYTRSSRLEWEYWKGEHSVSGNNASLIELKSVSPQLKVLTIDVREHDLLPKDLVLEKLERFQAYIGKTERPPFVLRVLFPKIVSYLTPNVLEIVSTDHKFMKENIIIQQLWKKSEILRLENVDGLNKIVYEEGLPKIQHLEIKSCCDLEYLDDSSYWKCSQYTAFPDLMKLSLVSLPKLKEIIICQHGPDHMMPPCNCYRSLRSLEVYSSMELKSAFTWFQATSLGQLQRLHIGDCDKIEFVVSSAKSKKTNPERNQSGPVL